MRERGREREGDRVGEEERERENNTKTHNRGIHIVSYTVQVYTVLAYIIYPT